MNTGMAVLLALVLIAVVLLIVWLVLRSRSGSADASAAAQGETDRDSLGGSGDARNDTPGSAVPAGVGAAAAPDPAGPDEVERTGAAVLGSGAADQSDGADLAEEYADPGLSRLEDTDDSGAESAVDDAPDRGAIDDLPASAPRTPAEAFGDAHGLGAGDGPGLRSETSVLDEPDADSTPLFRSMREERLAGGGSVPADTTALPADEPEVVGERPDLSESDGSEHDGSEHDGAVYDGTVHDRSWSEERRGWDEQAHEGPALVPEDVPGADAVPVTEAVAAPEATPEEPSAPTDEEDHDVPTDQETSVPTAAPETAADQAPAASEPPMRRISELHEVVDGGFGIGSAAPIADGAQPLGHPIKANVDTKTYQDLHSPWYDTTEPDVWFLDAGFAERAGFHRAE